MSFEAMNWAMNQRVAKASSKFVLVAMANCVNGEGAEMLCWPSMQHIADVTLQDRKTVVESIKRLREAGFIEDTGQRKGATGQVVVYRLTDPKDTPLPLVETHYVYRLSDPKTGEFYFGVRTCFGGPVEDGVYRGSGRWCQVKRLSGIVLDKEIISTYPSRVEAEAAEQAQISRTFMDPKCMNLVVKRGESRTKSPRKSGPLIKVQSNPNSDVKKPEIPHQADQFSLVSDPISGHGTSKEPGRKQERTKKGSSFDPTTFPLPEWLPRADWGRWCTDRRKRGKAVTEEAAPLQLKSLAKYRADGIDPIAVIDNSIACGYQGLFPPKGAERGTTKRGRHGGFRETPYETEGVTDGTPDA